MKNIFYVYKRDLKNILRNAMAMIVIIGITAIPSLYAWFNIAANWDPYGATNGIMVAVANDDAGTTIEDVYMNLGDQIVDNLKTNNQIGWEFVSKEDAVEGAKSGKYYAAIVVPEDFSSCLSSILTADIQRPQIQYYSNEKKNAIAPKITDKGASSIQSQVNSTFISVATKMIDTVLKVTVDDVKSSDQNLIDNLMNLLNEANTNLKDTQYAINTFGDTVDSISGLIQTVDTATPKLDKIASSSEQALSDMKQLVKASSSAVNSIAGSISNMTQSAQNIGNTINSMLDDAYKLAQTDANAATEKLNQAYTACNSVYEMNSQVAGVLTNINNSLPVKLTAVDNLVNLINSNNNKVSELMTQINNAISLIRTNGQITGDIKTQLNNLTAEINGGITEIRNNYNNDIKPQLSSTTDDLYSTLDDTQSLVASIKDTTPNLEKVLKELDEALQSSKKALVGTSNIITTMEDKIAATTQKIQDIRDNKDLQQVLTILNNDPEILSTFMSSPVEIQTEKLYPIENYGSAMAPFYSTLAIWVGGIVLVAILKVNVKKKNEFPGIKPRHEYIGRYLLFLTIGFFQTTLICLGDLLFLNIQCQHPFLFMLSGWVSCFVFTLIIYTLTVSFGDVGKALSVILLVIQIGGSGGTFPIECTPQFFQNVYPFLPFTYTIKAMRECVAGMYGMYYWWDLLALLAFVPVALLLGLVLRKPLIKVNHFFEKRLEDTDVM